VYEAEACWPARHIETTSRWRALSHMRFSQNPPRDNAHTTAPRIGFVIDFCQFVEQIPMRIWHLHASRRRDVGTAVAENTVSLGS